MFRSFLSTEGDYTSSKNIDDLLFDLVGVDVEDCVFVPKDCEDRKYFKEVEDLLADFQE